MKYRYEIEETATALSPSLIFYRDGIQENIDRALEYVGDVNRLRPHVKTHKTREISRMLLEAGVARFKCATVAEAEMLASVEAPDVLLAYPMLGPNQPRMARLMEAYPGTVFGSLVDCPALAQSLSQVMQSAGLTANLWLDVDLGNHRTGIALGEAARQLYQLIADLPGLQPAGLHVYNGHVNMPDIEERTRLALRNLEEVRAFRKELQDKGLPVPEVVMGGTPQFRIYSGETDISCSPGTCFLHDGSYGAKFTDMEFTPAAAILTRVVSRPTAGRIALDVGYKAIASDPPLEKRCNLVGLPDAQFILQNEEHLVVETSRASEFEPGDVVYAVPGHICPTCALHKWAYVAQEGKIVDEWEIVARDRVIGI